MAGRKKRPYWLNDDDDGRTIADMSGVSRRNLLFPEPFRNVNDGKRRKDSVTGQEGNMREEDETASYRPWENRDEDKRETRQWIFSATLAGLLLVAVFIAAGWLVIQLMLWAWT